MGVYVAPLAKDCCCSRWRLSYVFDKRAVRGQVHFQRRAVFACRVVHIGRFQDEQRLRVFRVFQQINRPVFLRHRNQAAQRQIKPVCIRRLRHFHPNIFLDFAGRDDIFKVRAGEDIPICNGGGKIAQFHLSRIGRFNGIRLFTIGFGSCDSVIVVYFSSHCCKTEGCFFGLLHRNRLVVRVSFFLRGSGSLGVIFFGL